MSLSDDMQSLNVLRQWQKARLVAYGKEVPSFAKGPADVTVLNYFFRPEEVAAEYFPYTKCALFETWRHCGAIKTVIVSHAPTKPVVEFANRFPNLVEVQIEPSLLLPNRRPIDAMSVDCNSRLHERFSTSEVLIVQDDGFPVRPLLNRFLGRFDFIGAPFRRDCWYVQVLGRILRDWPSNGGFSLRSKRMCRLVSEFWHREYANKPFGPEQIEDMFYTKTFPHSSFFSRWRVHIAESRPAFEFCFYGGVQKEPLPDVFGFHSAGGFAAVARGLKE